MSSLIKATSLQGIDTLITELGGDTASIMRHCAIEVTLNSLETQSLTYRHYAELLE